MQLSLFYQCSVTEGDESLSLLIDQTNLLVRSGLLPETQRIYIGFTGEDAQVRLAQEIVKQLGSYETLFNSPVPSGGLRTLEALHWLSTRRDFYALYLHNELGTCAPSKRIGQRPTCLEDCCVTAWSSCVEALDQGYDCAGACFSSSPSRHYTGNFWWAKSTYLRTLPPPHTLTSDGFDRAVQRYISGDLTFRGRALIECPIEVSPQETDVFSAKTPARVTPATLTILPSTLTL